MSTPTTFHQHDPSALELPNLIGPEHPDYDQVRSAWNLAADQRPAGVVVATSVDEVIRAVNLGRAFGKQIAPQGTGHLAAALPDLDGTILVRTELAGVTVDPVRRVARVGAGTVWQEVVDAVTPHGLAALAGSSHDVGVMGYTLGGGMSWLARQYGFACNHVASIELVTAEGRLVRADEHHHPELFMALRGGGGNFGVVTAIELQLFPVTEVYAGMTVWPLAQAREVITSWVEWTRQAPDAVSTSLRILRLPPLPELPEPLRGTPIVVIDGAAIAGESEGAAMIHGFRSIGTPTMDTWGAMSPAGLLQIHMDPPAPVPAMGDTTNLVDLDEAGIDRLLQVVGAEVAPLLCVELRQLGGAMGRVPDGAGARGAIDGAFALFAVGVPMGPGQADLLHSRLTEVVTAMRAWSTGGFYLNFGEQGGAADGAFDDLTLARLQVVRRMWDPNELFLASHRIVAD